MLGVRWQPSFSARTFNALLTLLLMLAGALTAQAAGSLTRELSFQPEQVRIEHTKAGTLLLPGEGLRLLHQTGAPAVPFRSLQFVLPQGTRLAAATVTEAEWISLGHGLDVAKAGFLTASDGTEVPQTIFPAAERSDVFPPVLSRVGGGGTLHGYSIGSVEVYPVQVRSDGEVRLLRNAKLELELTAANGDVVRRRIAWPGRAAKDAAAVRAIVDNPHEVDQMAPPPGIPAELLASQDVPGGPVGKVPTLPEGEVEYIIITTDELQNEFQRLADDKTAWGLPAAVVTLSTIEANYRNGADIQETIREFLKDVYSDWGVRYVLLGGDTGQVPVRYAKSVFYPPNAFTNLPTDLYFSALDGNWNADADALYGEAFITFNEPGDDVDFLAELSLGRAPVNDVAQTSTFVDKVLAYQAPASPSYVARALFLAEVLFPQNFTPGANIILDGATYAEDLIFDSIISPGNAIESWRLYENNTEYPGAEHENYQAVMDSLQTGGYGLVVHEGHGFFFNMSVGDANILVRDADALLNSPQEFVLYALNCSSAAFDFDCLLERFIQNPIGGSVASIGSARAAFPSTANEYQQAFFDEVFVLKNTALGDAINGSRGRFATSTDIETADRWTHFTLTLLGDPAQEMWRKLPVAPTVVFPGGIDQDENVYAVNVSSSGSPVEGAHVTLQQPEGGYYETGVTDASGDVTFALGGLTTDAMTLNVMGTNLARTSRSTTVSATGAHIRAETSIIDDDVSAPSSGNSNAEANAGETIEWYLRFENNGNGSGAFGLSSTLVAVDAPGATVVDGSVAVGDIPGGTSKVGVEPFVVALDSSIKDGSRLQFEVQVSDGGTTHTQILELLVTAPQIEVVRVVVDDSAGNGDGVPQNGEVFDLRVELKNYGAGPSGVLTGTLSTGAAGVTINTDTAVWTNLELKGSGYPTADLNLMESDTSVENYLTLDISNSLGNSWTHSMELRGPSPPNEPTMDTSLGPDIIALLWNADFQPHALGFRVYRSTAEGGPFAEATQDALISTAFYADAGLPQLSRFYYYVTAVDSSGLESQPTAVVSASTAPPELTTSFPIPLALEVSGALAVGDVQGNGTLAVVLGSDFVYAIDSNGEELVDGDQDSRTFGPLTGGINNGQGATFTPSGVTLADLDDNGDLEIVAGSWDTNELFVFDGDGSTFSGWPRAMNTHNWGTPVVGDLDNNGDMEIVANTVGGHTYVFNHDGTDFFDGDSNPGTIGVFDVRATEGFNRTTPALFDLDGNGTLEIIMGENYRDGTDNSLRAMSPDGTEPPGWPINLGPEGFAVTSVAVGDMDDDGDMEIVFPCDNDSLYIFHHNGAVAAGFPKHFISQGGVINSLTPSPALGDFDGNGDLEMVLVSVWSRTTAFVFLMDHDGDVWPGWPVEVPGLSEGSPIIGDINGDGKLDIMFGIGGGAESAPNTLYAFNDDGSFVDGFPITLSGPVRGTPTICDFDFDGDVDIVYAGFDRALHVWDMPFAYSSQLTPWPTFHGNTYRTGVYLEHLTVAVGDDVPLGGTRPRVALQPNVPNPFNPATIVRFELAGPAGTSVDVNLTVFDLAGRRVRTLVSGPRTTGSHSVRWDGVDDAGRPVGSGVYFARLFADGESETRKMTLVK